jgi:hypothetical protein
LKWPAIRSAGLRAGQPDSDVSLGFSGLRAAASCVEVCCAYAALPRTNTAIDANAKRGSRMRLTLLLIRSLRRDIETPPVLMLCILRFSFG